MVFLGKLVGKFGTEATVGRVLAAIQGIHPDFSGPHISEIPVHFRGTACACRIYDSHGKDDGQ